jgi:hypothetical protein
MLERAKEVTRHEWWTAIEYARFADDLVILVSSHPRQHGFGRQWRNDYGRNWLNCK